MTTSPRLPPEPEPTRDLADPGHPPPVDRALVEEATPQDSSRGPMFEAPDGESLTKQLKLWV